MITRERETAIVNEIGKRSYTVKVNDVVKLEGKFRGFCIVNDSKKSGLVPTLYAENHEGLSAAEVAEEMIQMAKEFSKDGVNGFDLIKKDQLFVQLVSKNAIIQDNAITHIIMGMKLVVRCNCDNVGGGDDGVASFVVKKEHLSLFNMTEEVIIDYAMENSKNVAGYSMKSMEETLTEEFGMDISSMFGEPDDKMPRQYILTNNKKVFGAGLILDTGILNEFCEKHNCRNVVILPSSIHEVLLIPYNDSLDLAGFAQMVRDVNAEQVEPHERLADVAFLYDSSTKEYSVIN